MQILIKTVYPYLHSKFQAYNFILFLCSKYLPKVVDIRPVDGTDTENTSDKDQNEDDLLMSESLYQEVTLRRQW